jgi:exodeoxyribonuclease III
MEADKEKIIRIISWNVNGIRAAYRKGLLEFMKEADADIYCFQETKAREEQLPSDLLEISGFNSYFSCPVRKGYSGVCIYSRIRPAQKIFNTGIKRFDDEGRLAGLILGNTMLLNVYFPNGGASAERLDYKLDFYQHFLELIEGYRQSGLSIIFCGDVNTAHREIDLARPHANKDNTGFLPVERAWIDRVIDSGYIDIFREFDRSAGRYTWWDYKTGARDRNVGWRLDYFFVSGDINGRISGAFIMDDIVGSDHCPVVLELPADLLE